MTTVPRRPHDRPAGPRLLLAGAVLVLAVSGLHPAVAADGPSRPGPAGPAPAGGAPAGGCVPPNLAVDRC